jgi:hypothetical protein
LFPRKKYLLTNLFIFKLRLSSKKKKKKKTDISIHKLIIIRKIGGPAPGGHIVPEKERNIAYQDICFEIIFEKKSGY